MAHYGKVNMLGLRLIKEEVFTIIITILLIVSDFDMDLNQASFI